MSLAQHTSPTTAAPRLQRRRNLRGAITLLVLSLMAGVLAATSLAALLGPLG